jgi:uncharacterized protein YbjT (DUF2867 family)
MASGVTSQDLWTTVTPRPPAQRTDPEPQPAAYSDAMHILVTGGTGILGRQIVQQLSSSQHEVSVMSRRTSLPPNFPACQLRRADLASGEGLPSALSGVDSVIHCASNPKDLRASVDVRGTGNLIAAAKAGSSPHITYISIVGCDQIPVPYYTAKHRAEQLIRDCGLSYSIARATQFHDLLFQVLTACSKPPVAIIPKGFQFQPVSSGELAARLISITADHAQGRQPDFGGPERKDIADWMRQYLATTTSNKHILQAPIPGRIGHGFRTGKNTSLTEDHGEVTFAQFLSTR